MPTSPTPPSSQPTPRPWTAARLVDTVDAPLRAIRVCKYCKQPETALGPIGMWQHCPEHEGGALLHEWPEATAIIYVTECIRAGGDRDFYAVLAKDAEGKTVDVCHTGNGPMSQRNALFIAASRGLLARCTAFIERSLSDADEDLADYFEDGQELLEDLRVAQEVKAV